jgi:hypothetical protein
MTTKQQAAILILDLKSRGLLSPRPFLAAARQTNWGKAMPLCPLAHLYGNTLADLVIEGMLTLPESIAATKD